MFHEVEGDILLTEAKVICHGVAPNDHFNQGLALSLREAWPALYKDFRHYLHQSSPKVGTTALWGGAGGIQVVHLFTQEPAVSNHSHPGKAELKHVRHALQELAKLAKKEGFESLALPKLATGVGGLKWDDVYDVIQDTLGALDIPVYIYTKFVKGQKAQKAA